MEDDEDDFYGGGGAATRDMSRLGDGIKEEHDGSEDREEGEEDSDDDVEFTLEKPQGIKPEPAPAAKKPPLAPSRARTSSETKTRKNTPPVRQESLRPGSTAPPVAIKGGALTHSGKEGKDFPEIRTSTVDINANPNWPSTGRPITELDIDADLAEHSKPWRLPGTDQTDFFNYGFDEYTWAQYCMRQQTMAGTINQQKQEDAQLKAMFGGVGGLPGQNGGGGGAGGGVGGGMPPGMPSMPGMPNIPPGLEEMMQQAIQQGIGPDQLFQQMMMGGGMPGMAPPQPNQAQNNASPHPQSGHGFQPPSGPAAQQQNQHASAAGFPDNMDGYSPQQLAIMQQQQQGGGGQRGRRRGGRGGGFF